MLLRRVTDLFIVGANRYSDEEIAAFDDIIGRLAVEIEISARALLAVRLAPIANAPPKTIRALAFDDSIEVARPILIQSERLDDPTLVENAKNKGQEHLLAISQRRVLSEAVTDVLVARGDQQVVLSTAENRGARILQFRLYDTCSAIGGRRQARCVCWRPARYSPASISQVACGRFAAGPSEARSRASARNERGSPGRRRGRRSHCGGNFRRIVGPVCGSGFGRSDPSVGPARRQQGARIRAGCPFRGNHGRACPHVPIAA